MPRRAVVFAAASLFGALAPLPAAQPGPAGPGQPRLVVLLVVDQMRADYVPAFRADWTAGLRRLVDEGAWFTNAAYPYAQTFTCPGHATIATGTFPSRHGIVGNTWFDRSIGRQVTCTEDTAARDVRYGGSAEGGHSASRLLVPTLGEHMQRLHRARVVALSIKARSAIMLAGRQADAVTWLANSLDGWQTSTAFASRPLPVVKAFLDANPIDADHGKTWMRLLPPARYDGRDDAAGEAPPAGWTTAFPHRISGGGRPDRRFRTQWAHSPFADAYLGRFAADLVRTMRLGQSSSTDVLAVSFSAPDTAGHAFGPRSHEVRDIFAQLDRTIGLFLDRLDALVGRDHYVVALTSDHGVDERPDPGSRQTVVPSRLAALIDEAARAAAGPGQYVVAVTGGHVYFKPAMYEKLAAVPGGVRRVLVALAREPGIARAFSSEDAAAHGTTTDPLQRMAAAGHAPGRSGDLVFVLRAGFEPVSSSRLAANHGTASDGDRRVPVILAGPGVRPGQYGEPITPADIAPTLAAIAGFAMPGVQGRVLQAALLADETAERQRPR
jgi:predicted AlkP superfamily pyrophosphatase or phosphodiesterase